MRRAGATGAGSAAAGPAPQRPATAGWRCRRRSGSARTLTSATTPPVTVKLRTENSRPRGALGVATLIRHMAGAISALAGILLVIPFIVTVLPTSFDNGLSRYMLARIGTAPVAGSSLSDAFSLRIGLLHPVHVCSRAVDHRCRPPCQTRRLTRFGPKLGRYACGWRLVGGLSA